jgi:prophage maintenance system killer protein
MSDKIYPSRIKYKGYTITQHEGQVIISDIHRHEVMTINIKRPHTREELQDIFNFNASMFGFIKGGG